MAKRKRTKEQEEFEDTKGVITKEQEEFEDTKGVIRIYISKNRQHNVAMSSTINYQSVLWFTRHVN